MKVPQAQFEYWLTNLKTLTDNNQYSVTLPTEVANGQSIVLTLDEDVLLTLSNYDIKQDVQFDLGASKQSGVFIILAGELDMSINQDLHACIKSSSAGIFIADANRYQFAYKAGKLRMINFLAPAHLIQELAEQYQLLPTANPKNNLWLMPINGEILNIIEQIDHCSMPKAAKLLYIKGKLLELLSTLFEWLHTQGEISGKGMANTVEQMTQAAAIMEAEMQSPPTLLELARRVGVNDNKLKKAFKQVYQQTVFEYLNTKRMDRAMALLSEPGCSVKSVAHEVGFKHQGHFAAKFKAAFAITPAQLLKQMYK